MKGVALVNKRALDVMTGEVNRLLLLCQMSIIPLSYCVPRKVNKYSVAKTVTLVSIYIGFL